MSRAFLLQSFVFSVSLSLVAACAGSGGSTSGPLPQTGALAVGAAQRSASSVALKPSKSKYTSLYSFKGGTDGIGPWAGLVAVNGVFYGTTVSGGTNNSGHDPPPRFGSRQSRLGSPLRSGVEPPKWGQFISLRDRSAAKLDTP